LVLATLPVGHLGLGLSFIPSLPPGDNVRQAARQAQAGFSDGILSPTVLLLEAPGITSRRAALARLQTLLARRPGVAGVLGPANQIVPTELGLVLARDGSAARYLLVLADPPLGAHAITTLSRLTADLPDLLRAVGIPDARGSFAGDTAIAQTVVADTLRDLGRITVAALAANLLLLIVFLRALVAPVYLLASSVLALGATLGLTTWIFQDLLGHDGLTFYVPFAAAVLLVALGSDYNIFGVGHVWEEARHRPLPEAMTIAIPQSTRAITTAGVTLAVSFGLLAIVPLRASRELAVAMCTGILIDTLVVRSLVMPSLLTLVGPVSGWPSHQLTADSAPPQSVEHLGCRPGGQVGDTATSPR
jgi:RND superfamily putative drug exporter